MKLQQSGYPLLSSKLSQRICENLTGPNLWLPTIMTLIHYKQLFQVLKTHKTGFKFWIANYKLPYHNLPMVYKNVTKCYRALFQRYTRTSINTQTSSAIVTSCSFSQRNKINKLQRSIAEQWRKCCVNGADKWLKASIIDRPTIHGGPKTYIFQWTI